ncbi:hypothetical protein HUJ05_010993 [Dendroctonus ponderosae]|nr:hypothetical protein HUJ05_010993 [Dendroctonus ponderosae]
MLNGPLQQLLFGRLPKSSWLTFKSAREANWGGGNVAVCLALKSVPFSIYRASCRFILPKSSWLTFKSPWEANRGGGNAAVCIDLTGIPFSIYRVACKLPNSSWLTFKSPWEANRGGGNVAVYIGLKGVPSTIYRVSCNWAPIFPRRQQISEKTVAANDYLQKSAKSNFTIFFAQFWPVQATPLPVFQSSMLPNRPPRRKNKIRSDEEGEFSNTHTWSTIRGKNPKKNRRLAAKCHSSQWKCGKNNRACVLSNNINIY